jgi:hypothetical protein
VANREKEVTVARKEAERAAARAKMLESDAEREAAQQKVLTVQATAEAERLAAKQLIAARQVIEQEKARNQTNADVMAYTMVKEAEGERQAAELQYEARLRLAEGDAQAAMKKAAGEKSQKMVDVEVDRERVDVERARVEVERTSLANKQEFEGAALRFELEKLRIEADRAVRVETAESMSKVLQGARVQLFGDPATVGDMMRSFTWASSLGSAAGGLLASLPVEVRELLTRLGVPPGGSGGPADSAAPRGARISAEWDHGATEGNGAAETTV